MFSKITGSATVAVVSLLAASANGLAQDPTLAERVEANGGKPVRVTVSRDVAPTPIAALASSSDLVVVGRLLRRQSYLSPNKTQIFTDYEFVPGEVLLARQKDQRTAPGPAAPLILTVFGGQITLNGVQVTMVDEKMKPVRSGAEFLVFAKRAATTGNRFEPTNGSAGIYEVGDNRRLEPLFRRIDADPEVHGVPFAEIVRRIQSAAPPR